MTWGLGGGGWGGVWVMWGGWGGGGGLGGWGFGGGGWGGGGVGVVVGLGGGGGGGGGGAWGGVGCGGWGGGGEGLELVRVVVGVGGSGGVLMGGDLGEVIVWSFIYAIVSAAPAGTDLLYFAFVNYTTLGYGDVTPVERWHLLGPMTAMNGVLLFGWSTAVIFEVLRMTLMANGNEGAKREKRWWPE